MRLPLTPVSLPPPTTPINLSALRDVAAPAAEPRLLQTVLTRLERGADIGYTGPHISTTRPNNLSARSRESAVSVAIEREVSLGHTAGPFLPDPSRAQQMLSAIHSVRDSRVRHRHGRDDSVAPRHKTPCTDPTSQRRAESPYCTPKAAPQPGRKIDSCGEMHPCGLEFFSVVCWTRLTGCTTLTTGSRSPLTPAATSTGGYHCCRPGMAPHLSYTPTGPRPPNSTSTPTRPLWGVVATAGLTGSPSPGLRPRCSGLTASRG